MATIIHISLAHITNLFDPLPVDLYTPSDFNVLTREVLFTSLIKLDKDIPLIYLSFIT